jgi:hypothetical protein
VPNDIHGGLHMQHMAIFSWMPWLSCRRIRVSTVWGPNNMWAPKQVRSYWDLLPKGLLVWVKPQAWDDLKNKGPRMRW